MVCATGGLSWWLGRGWRVSDGPVVCAWGDESIRLVGVARPMYLLGAVIADPAICDEVRAQLRRVPRTGQKLHWRDADEQHHRLIHRAVAPMPVQHVVVVASPADPRRPERARANVWSGCCTSWTSGVWAS